MGRLIECAERVIDNGWPWTVVFACLWAFLGWPLYVVHEMLHD